MNNQNKKPGFLSTHNRWTGNFTITKTRAPYSWTIPNWGSSIQAHWNFYAVVILEGLRIVTKNDLVPMQWSTSECDISLYSPINQWTCDTSSESLLWGPILSPLELLFTQSVHFPETEYETWPPLLSTLFDEPLVPTLKSVFFVPIKLPRPFLLPLRTFPSLNYICLPLFDTVMSSFWPRAAPCQRAAGFLKIRFPLVLIPPTEVRRSSFLYPRSLLDHALHNLRVTRQWYEEEY